MNERVTVVGGGSWGTALANLIAGNNHQVSMLVRDHKLAQGINQDKINYKYFPSHRLAGRIDATTDLEKGVKDASIILLAVPTHVTREIVKTVKPYLSKEQIVLSTAKGFEVDSFLRNSEIIEQMVSSPVVVLSGPTHAEEVIAGLPTAAVVSCANLAVAQKIQDMLMTSSFRVYTNQDIIGVEVGGAVKNVIAVAAGIADGQGYGDNTRAALITRGLHEMSRLGAVLGGQLLTFAGLTGMGDLVVTCSSMYSRNRRFGIKIGQGMSFQEALDSVSQVVEGVKTTKAIYQWYQERDREIQLPITSEIYQVLFADKDPYQAVEDLMLRGPKQEIEELNL